MIDETSDSGHHEQFFIIIRCYDLNKNKSVEYFVELLRLVSMISHRLMVFKWDVRKKMKIYSMCTV